MSATVRIVLDLPAHVVLEDSVAQAVRRLYFRPDGTVRDNDDHVVMHPGGEVLSRENGIVGSWEVRP